MTIPVKAKSRFTQPIDQVEIIEPRAERRWRTIESAYAKAHACASKALRIKMVYGQVDGIRRLTAANEIMLRTTPAMLRLTTIVTRDVNYRLAGGSSKRLLDIC